MTVQPKRKLTQFSLIEEIKEKYYTLNVITSPTEYSEIEQEIIELEKELKEIMTLD